MKIKILTFVMALTVLFGTMYVPEKVYAAEDYTFTFCGQNYDFSQVLNDSNIKYYLNGNNVDDYKVLVMLTGRESNKTIFRVFFVDTDKAKGLIMKFSEGSEDEWVISTANGLRYVSVSFCAEKSNGTFDVTNCKGIYTTEVSFIDGALDFYDDNVQDLSSGRQISIVPSIFESHYYWDETCKPSLVLDMHFDGDVTVKGAEYNGSEWVLGSVFFKPLPQTVLTKVAKGMKMNPLNQIVKILPIVVPLLVGFVALRKGLAILAQILHQA